MVCARILVLIPFMSKILTIGVLGGMGPEATNQLCALITANTAASRDQDHIPVITYNNSRIPERVRSLTLIEPPLFYLVPGDPEVARLERMGNAVLTHGLEADAATLREFLRLAGAPEVDDGPLPDEIARGVRRAHGGRLPGEARPALELVRDAGIPSLVASGGHAPGLERICDALSTVLDAQRLVAPGAGHFVAAAPGFVNRLHEFLVSAA